MLYIDLQTGEFHIRYGTDYKLLPDGWGYLLELNKQGYGIYFVVAHGGENNSDITHGTCLFHESDRATFDQQQLEIDRISSEFGLPTAVVKTRKSIHGYWKSEIIRVDELVAYQRRWLQYSNCDDHSLADPAQLMRLPGFDHVSWNPETQDFDRVECQLLQLNDVSYNLEQFDRILPELDLDLWSKRSLAVVESEATDRDMRTLAQYLDGYDPNGRVGWITAKCPAHNGESDNGLHINIASGGFIGHCGCSSSSIYNATKAKAVAAGHRFEAKSDESLIGLGQSIDESLNLKNRKAPVLFGGTMGKLLRETAINFNITQSILEFIALPVLASRIPAETRLLINPGTDFSVPAIRFCGLVGETGTMKSPIIRQLTKPLSKQQAEIHRVYKEAKQTYDLEFSSWKANKSKDKGNPPQPPSPMLDLFFSNYTIEALADSIQHHPDSGYLILLDELASFVNALDQYRGGKGCDRQQWLTMWDGGEIKVNRKSGNIYVPHVSLSVVGGIQPQTIRIMIANDEGNLDGFWHRFSFVPLPDTSIDPFTALTGDLGDELSKIYTSLSEQVPQTYWLSIESKPVWSKWHYEIDQKRRDCSHEMTRGIYPKFLGIAGRNALIMHCTYAAIAGTVPDQLIPASTVEIAIEWTRWELAQTLMQHQLLGLTDDPELARILKFIDKFADKDWISAADARAWWSIKPKPSVDELRAFMKRIVDLGHAIDNDESVDSGKYRIQILEKSSRSSRKNAETQSQQQESERLPWVANFKIEKTESCHSNGLTTSTTQRSQSSRKVESEINIDLDNPDTKTSTTFATQSSRSSETTLNGRSSDSGAEFATHGSRSINATHSNGSSIFATTSTTFPSKNILEMEEATDDDLA